MSKDDFSEATIYPEDSEKQIVGDEDGGASRITVTPTSINNQQDYNHQTVQLPLSTTASTSSTEKVVLEVGKKGGTSVITVSNSPYSEPIITFPLDDEAENNDALASGASCSTPVTSSFKKQNSEFQPVPVPRPRTTKGAAAKKNDNQMSLDNFTFCTVLGRGHFGKVSQLMKSTRRITPTDSDSIIL